MNGSKITYHQQVSYCGKPNCRRCREGIGHGPYWYAYQTVNGRTIRTYIGKHPPPEMRGAIEEARGSLTAPDLAGVVVRLYVLGQFRLEYRNEKQQWQPATDAAMQHQRVRALLHCLISSPGRKLGREQAIEMLWPDLDFETATHRLDRAVYSLRRLFEPGRSRPATSNLLFTEHQTLQLADQAQLWIDADAFDSLLSQARASNDPGQTEQLLEEAMLLYSGDYLPEERDIPWIQTRREALQRSWIGLLLELADLRIAREAQPGAIDTLDRLLAVDPTNEAAVQRLIILLTQSGRRAEAMRIYQRFAAVLRQEYKIAPLPETRTLYESARRGEDPIARMRTNVSPGVSLVDTQAAETQPADAHTSMQVGRSNQSPLVGRESELEILHRLLLAAEQARRMKLAGQRKGSSLALDTQRPPQCIILMGDVGIGKTRLAEETGREAKRRGWAVAWTRAYAQESSIPYHVWVEALRKAMTQGLWQRQEISRHPLTYQALGALLPELHDLLPQVAPPSTTLPEQEQLLLWEATRALLATISEGAPLFVVLDDLQWADSSSCELLAFLVRQMRGQPVMIVGTCREIELPPNHALRRVLVDLQREQAVETLTIHRLTDEQIRALVSHLPEPMVQHIQVRAAGNPFFAEELARGVGSSHFVPAHKAPPEGGAVRDTVSLTSQVQGPTSLPDTISAVLDLRMGRISSACQRLLVRAAVLGGSFEFNTIRSLEAGGPDAGEDTILDLLEEALQAGMLTEEGSGTRITYHFWHPLLVSHLYDGLSAGRRASFHRRAAEVLQQTYQGRVEEGAAAIAYHLVNGGAESPQIAHFAEIAGDRAYALSAYPEAERHYRLAVEHIRALPEDAGREERLHLAYLLERLGECTMIQGNFEEARRFYERVLEVRSDQQSSESTAELQYEAQLQALLIGEIGRTWYSIGNDAQAQQCFEHAEQVLHEAKVSSGPAWARLRFQQSSIYWQEGNHEEALRMADEALTLFEEVIAQPQKHSEGIHARFTGTRRILEGDPVDLGRTHRLLGLIANSVGQPVEALAHLNEALTLFEQHDRQREIAYVCCDLGYIYLKKAEHTPAQAAMRRSLSLAEALGDVPLVAIVFFNLGELATRLGNLVEAETWYKRSLTLAEQINDQVYISLWKAALALLLQNQNKISEAAACIRHSLAIGRAMNIAPCIGLSLVTLGNMRVMQALAYEEHTNKLPKAVRRGRANARTHLLRSARTNLQRALTFEGIEVETRTEGQLTLAQVSLLEGEPKIAQRQAIQAMHEAGRYELTWLFARSQHILGSILAAQGQQEQAEGYFELAIQTFRDSGMRLEWARTLQSYGMTLLEQDSTGDASYEQGLTYLQDARQVFQECNATFDLQMVERILARYSKPALTSTGESSGQTR